MKFCSPKNILVILIFVFLIFNLIFLIKYLYNFDKDEIKRNIITDNTEAIEFLKLFVDFNHTAFENKEIVHFYYPANKKIDFSLNLSEYNENTQKNCEYYYERDESIFLDSRGNLCIEDNFNIMLQCCDGPNIQINITYGCDEIKCCKKEYSCISNCMKNSTFQVCSKICKMSKDSDYPYCFEY